MSWFKVDDKFHTSEPVKRIPRAVRMGAIGLWTLAGSWSSDHLKDGYVPEFMVEELGGTSEQAAALVEVKLWRRVRDGYRFNKWDEWQQTREQVEANRQAEKDKKAAWRARKAGKAVTAARGPEGVPEMSTGDTSVRPGSVPSIPTRPDPTINNSSSETPPRPDVERLCSLLVELIVANGGRKPNVTKGWRDAARLLLDRDGVSMAEALRVMRWSQSDAFWRSNVLSMPTFREKFDQLRLKSQGGQPGGGDSWGGYEVQR